MLSYLRPHFIWAVSSQPVTGMLGHTSLQETGGFSAGDCPEDSLTALLNLPRAQQSRTLLLNHPYLLGLSQTCIVWCNGSPGFFQLTPHFLLGVSPSKILMCLILFCCLLLHHRRVWNPRSRRRSRSQEEGAQIGLRDQACCTPFNLHNHTASWR